jgi:hypothetical protein
MREPWSTEECPGKTKADYKKPIIAIDEKIKKKNKKALLVLPLHIQRRS